MEQNEKYYVPELSEFHVGFEYEMKFTKEGWLKEIFGIGEKSFDSIPAIQHALLGGKWEDHIRVKRLDHDDIVGEGWVLENETSVIENYRFYLTHNGGKHKTTFKLSRLKYRPTDIQIRNFVHELFGDFNHFDQLFSGEILNRSELRFIMKRLGIKK